MTTTLLLGECLEHLREIPDGSIHSCVTDPPYGLGFMGAEWDAGDRAFSVEFWMEVLRVLKPGGHLLAFSGTRTYHRMAVAIEDAGFDVRDMISWLYGNGLPKGEIWTQAKVDKGQDESRALVNAGYEGWARSGLKPSCEPICVGRKPFVGTVAANMLEHGVGALNINACRVPAVTRPVRLGRRSLRRLTARGFAPVTAQGNRGKTPGTQVRHFLFAPRPRGRGAAQSAGGEGAYARRARKKT